MVSKKMRKIALWTLLVVMLAGLVWAGLDLLGQSNKSAEMAFNNVDASKIDAYNDQQASLRKAQKAYFSEAKEDVSPQDLASLKSSLTPKLEKMGSDLMALVQSVTNILSQVKDQVGSTLSVGGIGGCAKQVATGGGTAAVNDGVASLLSPLQSLLSLVQSMGSNVQGMLSDIATF